MRCSLGSKKIRKIEAILGCAVKSATVRGGEAHYWASVTTVDGRHPKVNYRTKKVVWDVLKALAEPQLAFDEAWRSGSSAYEALAAAKAVEFRVWGF